MTKICPRGAFGCGGWYLRRGSVSTRLWRSRSVLLPWRIGVGALVALLSAACSGLTDVDDPDIVTPPQLDTPAGATALYAGAVALFGTALVDFGGQLMADEFISPRFSDEADDFRAPTAMNGGAYSAIHQARVNLLQAVNALGRRAPDAAFRPGELFALVGYSAIFLGEGWCSGVPLSEVRDSEPVFGNPVTTPQMFGQALADFDSAAAYGAESEAISHLASVGRGRALLNLGRPVEAAAAVAGVPTSYTHSVEYSAAGPPSNWLTNGFSGQGMSVADNEGINGLDFVSANDPRVPTKVVGETPDGLPVHGFTKYSSLEAPIVLASGVEARLIEAETALSDDAGAAIWLNILNDLRARAISPALPPLSDPGTPAARVDLLFRERAFWLFGTGHRLGDLRRLVRHYARDAESVFPTGAYHFVGVTYGTAVNYVPDASERHNPNYEGCIDRDA